jgi:LssY C-terminus
MTDTKMVLWLTLAWAAAAYLIVPRLWLLYFRRHPVLAELARVTQTSDGHPGDPINVALVGSDAEVVRGMAAAGWFPADPITLATSVRIVADSVLRRSDVDAPVSNLFLFSRKQDLAFEEPVGNSPRQRHHVRFCVGRSSTRGGPPGSAPRRSTSGSVSATPPDRSPITSVRTWMRSATASRASCRRPVWRTRLTGTTTSTPDAKGATVVAIPGTPTVAWRSWCCAVPLRTREGECSDRPRRNERRERQCVARQRR